MKRILTNLNIAGGQHALRAGLMMLTLGLSGCFDLTVSVSGSGQVTSNPAGIDCGSDCAEKLAARSTVTLSATPASGAMFTGWGGDCSGSTPSCTLTMSANRAVTASFTFTTDPPPPAAQYTLSVSVAGTGSVSSTPAGISCGADCTENYADGTSVTLTATPGTGFQFSSWSGACSGTGSCVVAMTEARNVIATFSANPPPVAQYTLSVSVTGTGSVSSTPAGISCGTDCTESYASGQSVTLSATAGVGFQFSSWGGACSGSGACVVPMNANRSVTVVFSPRAQDLIFFDNFEYEVGRDALDAADRFMQLGRWDSVKTEQSGESGANGHLYTVSAIPGYIGSFPGLASQRVLAMEARPDLGNGQTDFYLQFGSGTRPIGHIPPNHWFQFWVYSPDVPGIDGQRSLYTNAKFIYPNRADYYPATLNNGGYVYILGLNKRSKAPRNLAPCGLDRDIGCTTAFLHTGWNRSQGLTNRIPYQEEDFGANLADDVHVSPNQWTLVKIHMDISGTDSRATPGQAVFEMWIRRFGSSTWIKTTEYIGGVTDVGGGAINFTPAYTDGFRMLRIPTTFGSASTVPANWLASWTYLDDFTIAASEAALPQYSDLPAN